MTSFRELASDSPMCTSNYSERSQYDIMEEDENDPEVASFGKSRKFPTKFQSFSIEIKLEYFV